MINDKQVTIIISDQHIGGGPADPGDDHVYDTNQLRRFIEELSSRPEWAKGEIELFFNGDFLEFAQVRPDVYTLNSADYWCTEDESLQKLNAILDGHPDIFEALKNFQTHGNRVTLVGGNHDVDLYWDAVQQRLKQAAGDDVVFELKKEICTRYDGRLAIGHGHQIDPANKFKDWETPFGSDKHGKFRLEMCPGTLFMVKFVNKMEARYAFADNVVPFLSLARLLLREDKFGLGAMALAFSSFAVRNPLTFLGVDKNEQPNTIWAVQFQDKLNLDFEFLDQITKLYRKAVDQNASPADVSAALDGEEKIRQFLQALLVNVPYEEWIGIFDSLEPLTLSISGPKGSPAGGGGEHLGIMKSNFSYDKESLRRESERLWAETKAEVIVFGHTHQPDEYRDQDKVYFNPGSWTRYVDVTDMQNLRLADLRNEEDFPYELNYVEVRLTDDGSISAVMNNFERQDGTKFANRQ